MKSIFVTVAVMFLGLGLARVEAGDYVLKVTLLKGGDAGGMGISTDQVQIDATLKNSAYKKIGEEALPLLENQTTKVDHRKPESGGTFVRAEWLGKEEGANIKFKIEVKNEALKPNSEAGEPNMMESTSLGVTLSMVPGSSCLVRQNGAVLVVALQKK